MSSTLDVALKADSISAVKGLIQKKLEEGYYVVSEEVLSDGSETSKVFTAPTVAEAFVSADTALGKDCKALSRREVSQPGQRDMVVKATSLKRARKLATQQCAEYERVDAVELDVEGKSLFLGVLRLPDTYIARLVGFAAVEVTYRPPAAVRASLRKLPSPSELAGALGDLERQVADQWAKLDTPLKGGITALMVMSAAFQFLRENVAKPFNDLLRDAQALYPDKKGVQQLLSLELGSCKGAYDTSDIPVVSEQFGIALERIALLRKAIES